MEQRWRYQDSKGRMIWLAFDPAFLCVFCESPVVYLSMGGPAICPTCDCGYNHDGTKWSYADYDKVRKNAQQRFDQMLDDPMWQQYEDSWNETKNGPVSEL